LQKCYREWGYGAGSFPVTERVASEILSLPMFPGLTEGQQQRIADVIKRFVRLPLTVSGAYHPHQPVSAGSGTKLVNAEQLQSRAMSPLGRRQV
jgi:hypothetical protein